MRFRLLGALAAESGGLDLAPVRPKQRALLALLLLRAGETLSLDELVDALWGGRPPPTATAALYGHVSELRKRLGAERIVKHAPGYGLRLLEGDELDVTRFEELTAAARAAGGATRARLLAEALGLFRGEPLADFRFEQFATLEIARLEELRLSALEDQLETDLELARHNEAIPRLESLIAEHPERERLHGQLMLALFRAGRQADALRTYRDARAHLVEELGVEPSRSLRELEQRILNQDRELAAPGATPSPAASVAAGFASWVAVRTDDESAALRTALAQCGGSDEPASTATVVASFARARDAVAGALAIHDVGAGAAAVGIHSTADRHAGSRGAETLARAARPGDVLLSRAARDLLTESPLGDLELVDAGRHRLDDLGPAWQLFRLAAPGLAAGAAPPRATTLPAQSTPLVGRESELRDLHALLVRPDVRLATLTGPAGVGKSRLAVQAAARAVDAFPDGVLVVDLAPVSDPPLVFEAIAAAVGLGSAADLEQRIADYLRRRSMLIVLDNLEHLLSVGTSLADAVAGGASTLLATSRVPLRAEREQIVAVEPLPPDDAARLFAVRATAVRADFELTPENAPDVARICARLDGLPLAIELAASRAAVLSPAALRDRLDRHVGLALHAAIEWSYELQPEDCRRMFEALAVFAGGFDLDAAEAVVSVDLPDAVAALATLVDASLVRTDGGHEPRFGLLETVRAYAVDRLEGRGNCDVLRRRHAEWFARLAAQAEPHLREAPGRWLERLERENDNLRVALDWLEAHDTEAYIRLATALWRFWYLSGRLTEGRRRLEHAVASEPAPSLLRAKALLGLTVMYGNLGEYATSSLRAEETLAVSREVDDDWTAAYATNLLARARYELGDPVAAERLHAESAAAFREYGDTHSALIAARNLALLLERVGERDRARAQHEDNLRAAAESGNQRIEASTLGALAALAAEDGRTADALQMLRRCLALHRDAHDVLDTALDLSRCAYVLARSGDLPSAARLLFVFERFEPRIGSRVGWIAARNEVVSSAIRDALSTAAVAALREEARTMTLDDALRSALEAI
jgi:predicted ATPase/DNA-binding SARP family transcriptional activator